MAIKHLLLLFTMYVLADGLDPSFYNNLLNVDSMESSFPFIEKTPTCDNATQDEVNYLLPRMHLIYFYGIRTNDIVVVTLPSAASLVEHPQWKRDKPMALYSVGWLSFPTDKMTMDLVKAYHSSNKYNLVVVDWAFAGAYLKHEYAATLVPGLGRALAESIKHMLHGGQVKLHHLAGHDLGAHISGHIGRNLGDEFKPELIMALDPSGPLFYHSMVKCVEGIRCDDGKLVVYVLTDMNHLGSNEPSGQINFVAGEGMRIQAGCKYPDNDEDGLACSHRRAVYLWAEAVQKAGSIIGRLCHSWKEFESGKCSNASTADLSAPDQKLKGIFFFRTNPAFPFGRGEKGA